MEVDAAVRGEENTSKDLQGDQDGARGDSATEERRQRDGEESTAERDPPQPFSESDHAHLAAEHTFTLETFPREELIGSIQVDRSQVDVGETVGVAWDVSHVGGWSINHMDFLGMFDVSEGAPVEIDHLLDSKLRGFNNSRSGRINWSIQSDHLQGRTYMYKFVGCL